MKYLSIHTSLQENKYTKKMQVTSGIFHGIKSSGPNNRCDLHAVYDGKVGCNTVEYTTVFIWLIGCTSYGMV